MDTYIHVAFDCGGEIVPTFETYGHNLPDILFICQGCGHIVGSVADAVRVEGIPLDATADNVAYAGEEVQ